MGIPLCFSSALSIANYFSDFQKRVYSQSKEFAPIGANSFL